MIEGFHLLRPWWLLALAPLAWAWWRGMGGKASNPWAGIVDDHLLPHLIIGGSATRRARNAALLGLWTLAVLALAGPAWDRSPPVHYRTRTPPLVILLDLSRSMDAVDLAPSRLERARAELHTLLERMPARPVALLVFAGRAFQAVPFTEDLRIVRHTLDVLETGMMPLAGSVPAAAIEQAAELLERAGAPRADLLLVGDQGSREAVALAKGLTQNGGRTSVLALGTAAGGAIPGLDSDDNPARPALDEAGLKAVAAAGDGLYLAAAAGDADTDALLGFLYGAQDQARSGSAEAVREWRDRGPWVLLLIGPLALASLRRAGLFALVPVLALAPLPTPAQDLPGDWTGLWQTPDQRAYGVYREGDFTTARERFADPLWRGTAAYRDGEYREALAAFEASDAPLAHYNRGNALVRLGRLDEARDAYRRALELAPRLDDARHNLALLTRFLEQGLRADGEGRTSPEGRETPRPKGPDLKPDDLPTPDPSQLEKAPPGAAGPDDNPGSAGAGAMLLEGRPLGNRPESDTRGQGLGGEGDRETEPDGAPGQGERQPVTERTEPSRSPETAPVTALAPPPHTGGTSDRLTPRLDRPGAEPPPPRAEPPEERSEGPDRPAPAPGELDEGEPDVERPAGGADSPLDLEQRQAVEQWLARIPETGTGFLREKFLREHRRDPLPPVRGPEW